MDPVGALGLEDAVRLVLDPAGDVGVGRAAVGRVVLEPAIVGRVVGRRDDDAVGQATAIGTVAVRDDDGVGNGRGRRVPVVGVDPDVDPVRHEDLERGPGRRLGEGMSVAADEQRAVGPLRAPVPADGLADGDDVGLVEGASER